MKLKITFLIVLALFLGAMPGLGQVENSGTIAGSSLTWELNLSDGTLTISAPNGPDAMPNNERPWYDLFSANIKSVVIGDGVTSIGDNAFSQCYELTSVELSETVTSIGYSAFSGCRKLLSIDLNEVASIAPNAFRYCGLTSSITIPEAVTSIGEGAFSNCEQLETVIVDDDNTAYVIEDGILYNIENNVKKVLLFYPIGKMDETLDVPNTVETIGTAALRGNRNLKTVNIPESVTRIGDQAFDNCTSLSSVNLSEGLQSIGWYSFGFCAFTSIELPESLTYIGGYAFAYSKLTSISIPKNVNSIGEGIVANCTSMQSIEVDQANTVYLSDEDVIYNDDRTRLVMYSCGNSNPSFEVPDGVTVIGGGAFAGSTTLTSVTLPASVTAIEGWAFSGCSNLDSINLDNVQTIGFYALQSCGFTSIVIPGGVTTIQNGAFNNCTRLASVTIQEGVTTIEANAFRSNYALNYVSIPGSVTNIGNDAFAWCNTLPAITIPSSVTHIGARAFAWCEALSAVTIPGSVNEIGLQAFASCRSLKDVTVHWQNPISPAISAFDNIHNEAVLHVPNGTGEDYSAANVWKDFIVEELETLVAEENEPSVTGNEGSIALSLSIPANSTIVGTFKVILPAGMSIDPNRTTLVESLLAEYELTFEKIDNENAWQFTISAIAGPTSRAALRSVSQITRIMDIGFTLDDDVEDGKYEVKLEELNLKLVDLDTKVETAITDLTELTVEVRVDRTTAATSITITQTGPISGTTGGTTTLTATVGPEDATDTSVTWSSSDETVAIVGATTGVVTFAGPGTATITAKANGGTDVSASITITVTDPPAPDPEPEPDPNLTDVYAAIASVQFTTVEIPQSAGATEAAVAKWLEDYYNALLVNYGVTVSGITFSAFEAATPGSLANVHGKDGAVTFSAIFSKGQASVQASFIHGTIKAAPYEGSGNEVASGAALKAVSDNGAIIVTGLSIGDDLKIYNISGKLIYNVKAYSTEVRVAVARGIYIVTSGKKALKVLVR